MAEHVAHMEDVRYAWKTVMENLQQKKKTWIT